MARRGVWRTGLVAAFALAAPTADANTPQECIALWGGLSRTNQTQGVAQQDFMAACLAHKVSPSASSGPALLAEPANATGRCRDGAYTAAAIPLSGCARHGGVASLLHP